VFYTLEAVRDFFHLTFVSTASAKNLDDTKAELLGLCDEALVLPSRYAGSVVIKAWHKAAGIGYGLATGLKFSNYVIGKVEFPPARLRSLLVSHQFDCVIFEYWHAAEAATVFQERGIPCVLDMHDVLWQSYDRQLANHQYPWMRALRSNFVQAYRRREEAAWAKYDALIAITSGEADYVRGIVPEKKIIVAPMGTDLNKWPYCWSPMRPPRLAFYGNLASRVNRESVLHCFQRVMPLVWKQSPETEFWVVGGNPSQEILALGSHPRVNVTGFVSDVVQVMSKMTGLLCPWSGTYGFRSRLVEVMALGVPVVATPDAVFGMGMENNRGILLFESNEKLADCCLALIREPEWAVQQSRLAREQIEERFDLGNTYGHLAQELYHFARSSHN
jgi:glycosyltransferase involved in cell wall biosynthesis